MKWKIIRGYIRDAILIVPLSLIGPFVVIYYSHIAARRRKKEALKMENFQNELRQLINRYIKENGSNTPDFILAYYLEDCLENFNKAVNARNKWHDGNKPVAEIQMSNGDEA